MTTLRGSAHHLPAPRARFDARSVVIALAAALAITLTALVIVLATSSGGSEPVQVAPTSSQLPAPEQRHQPLGMNGPGARP